MLWGNDWSCFWGTEEEMLATLEVDDLGDGPRVRFQPHSGYDQYCRLEIDGVYQGAAFYASDAGLSERLGVWPTDASEHAVTVELLGDWADSADRGYQQQFWIEDRADTIRIAITTAPALIDYNDGGQLANWSLTGLERFTNCMPVKFRRTWGALEIILTNAAGTRTVQLRARNTVVASGSRVGDGTITLTAQNDSGLSGSVDVTYSADIAAATSYVVARFPAKIHVHYRTSSFAAPDFPRTPEAIIYDDGHSNTFTFVSPQLDAGTYYVVCHQVDENANESAGLFGGGDTAVLVDPPGPPTSLAVGSGNAAATVIQWTASATAGATYRIYDSGETGILDLNTVSDTHAAGAGTISHTMAAITATWTGVRYILVRALSGSVEEGNAEVLAINYVNGWIIPALPPAPTPAEYVTTAGRALTVPAYVSTAGALGTAAYLHLFAYDPDATSAPDWDNPDDVVTLGSAVGSVISTKSTGAALTAAYTASGNKRIKFALRTATAVGAFRHCNGDSGSQLSGWSFTGGALTNTNGGWLYWSLSDAGGTRTVSVYKDAAKSSLVAQGSRVGDGAITLSAQGGSGLSGAVTVTYTGDDTDAGNSIALNASSDNTDEYGPVELTTAAPADPTQAVTVGL